MAQQKLFRQAASRRGQAEPINGLLRVTAPHEWVILAVLALMVLAVLLWAVFGRIERTLTADCVVAQADERFLVAADAAGTVVDVVVGVGDSVVAGQTIAHVRTTAEDAFVALAVLDTAAANQLNTDMTARVSVVVNGKNVALSAKIGEIASRGAPLPEWLREFGLPSPQNAHLVRFDLVGQGSAGLLDGETCRVRIVLGSDRPVQFLAATRAI